jgi:hypothetical protein
MKNYLLVCLLFSLSGSTLAADSFFDTKCSIHSAKEAHETFDNCAKLFHDGRIRVSYKVREKIVFGKNDLGELYIENKCYWASRTGKIRRSHCVNNSPDAFVEGLARYVASTGKFGFIDDKLEVVIPPLFDFVFPFEKGKAKYCKGCVLVPDGENFNVQGGSWGIVNKNGKLVSE